MLFKKPKRKRNIPETVLFPTVQYAIEFITENANRLGFKVSQPYAMGVEENCLLELSYDGVILGNIFIYDWVTHAVIKFNRIYSNSTLMLGQQDVITDLNEMLDDIKSGKHLINHENFKEIGKFVLKVLEERPDLVFYEYYGVWVDVGSTKLDRRQSGIMFIKKDSYDGSEKETIYVHSDLANNCHKISKRAGMFGDDDLITDEINKVYQFLDNL